MYYEMIKYVVNKINFIRDIVDFGLVMIYNIYIILNLVYMLFGNVFEELFVTFGVVILSSWNVFWDGFVV